MEYLGGCSTSSGDHFTVHSQDTFEGKAVYCIEQGIGVEAGDRYNGFDESFSDNYPSMLNPTISPVIIRAYIGRIMQCGWQGNANASWDRRNNSRVGEMAGYFSTQILVRKTVSSNATVSTTM